jgi:hypothetical protein
MKPVRYGKTFCGETINKVLPRMEYFKQSMTIMEVKRFMYKKISAVFKEGDKKFKNDQELNDNILLHIFDNLPYERTGQYSQRKAQCEFCDERHG